MKTEFETELREAFAARAAAVPVAAASRLRSMDYRPRERRLRAPVAVGAGVLASAGTAGAVLSVVLGARRPPTPGGVRLRRPARARHRPRLRRAARVN